MIFFDNDVIHKLAYCDLLENVSVLLNPSNEIYVLDTALYVLKGKTKKQGDSGVACYARIESFISKKQCYIPSNTDIIPSLIGIRDIDGGEAIFIEGLISHSGSSFITGDKRCLKALANSDFYKSNTSQLTQKAICFEQVILWLIEKLGFDVVRTKIIPTRDHDSTLRDIFTASVTQESANEGLNSYLNDLRAQTGDLLCSDLGFL